MLIDERCYMYSGIIAPTTKCVVVDVEEVKSFVLRTKDKDYTLDFQMLHDYGVVK